MIFIIHSRISFCSGVYNQNCNYKLSGWILWTENSFNIYSVIISTTWYNWFEKTLIEDLYLKKKSDN